MIERKDWIFGPYPAQSVIMVDQIFWTKGAEEALANRRDMSLESVGIRVMRIAASDILTDIDSVLQRITLGMRSRIADKKEAARAHAAANPNQHYSRPRKPGPHRDQTR